MLSKEELERYGRQMMIEGFGQQGQEKLKKARVFIAGLGGLGSLISIYLAVAGVGKLRVVDRDRVELSNLNRQILHWDSDIGRRKTEVAGAKLRQMNQNIEIEAIDETIDENNVLQIVGDCDLIVDALDNFSTRYVLNRAAITRNIPFFHGGIYGLQGMATTVIPGKTACLKCIFPKPPPQSGPFPVVGVTPALIGCIESMEVIKYIVGIGNLLTNRLLFLDGLDMKFREIAVSRNPQCADCSSKGDHL